ncbi:TetR family transcriptional regulator [Oceanicella sp. SM1341]|uniref:TetR family transcriptional regulator n=1 Tax=Oceanicella sp. SM1341 TaxID=1548889 RepID=UPI0018E58F49|nr:TetR family transcriptional regulator [Oceanicella sp. SM1341]
MRRTKEQAARTRADILAAAYSLFAEKGFEQTSLEAIAEAAGVTRGAIYWYFANKAAILDAILEMECAPIDDLVTGLTGNLVDDPVGALSSLTREMFTRVQQDDRKRCIYSIMRQMTCAAQDAPRQTALQVNRTRLVHKQLEKVFAYAHRHGRLNPIWSPETAAMAYHALVTGLLEEWSREAEAFDIGARGGEIVELFLDHLAAVS